MTSVAIHELCSLYRETAQRGKGGSRVSCNVLVLYWNKGGNTRKVAEAIHTTVQGHGLLSEIVEITAKYLVPADYSQI